MCVHVGACVQMWFMCVHVGTCVQACMGIGFSALSIILWKVNEIIAMRDPKKHKVLCQVVLVPV